MNIWKFDQFRNDFYMIFSIEINGNFATDLTGSRIRTSFKNKLDFEIFFPQEQQMFLFTQYPIGQEELLSIYSVKD